MSVRLQNQGKRKIGVSAGNSIAPNTVAIVNNATADRLLRLYPKELIDIDNIKADFEEGDVQDFTGSAGKKSKGGKKSKVEEPDEDDDAKLAATLKDDKK